jgi:pyruvate dehydrogenase E2 component (dihydrolipoamide acetyltransferase)
MSKADIIVPDIGGFDNVEVIEVHVAVGDKLAQEDSIITLESDKATMDIPSPVAGTITELAVKVGDKIEAGHRFGLVRFGSRLDVFLPVGVQPKIVLGQNAVAGETVLADLADQRAAVPAGHRVRRLDLFLGINARLKSSQKFICFLGAAVRPDQSL